MSNCNFFSQLLAKTQLLLKILHQILWFQAARVAKLPDGDQIVFIKMGDSAFYLELFKAKNLL